MLCGHDIQSVVKQTSNFRKKVRIFLKKNPSRIDEPVPELNKIKNTNSNTESVVDIIGPFCERLNINRSLLHNVSKNKINYNLNNGAVLELDNERINDNATWLQFADWVFFPMCSRIEKLKNLLSRTLKSNCTMFFCVYKRKVLIWSRKIYFIWVSVPTMLKKLFVCNVKPNMGHVPSFRNTHCRLNNWKK